jgi:hypothetical protein
MRLSSIPANLLAGVFCFTGVTCSQPKLISSSAPAPLGSEATYVVKKIHGARDFEFKLVFFDEKFSTVRVVSNATRKEAKNLKDSAYAAKALAACNGGYFTPHFQPVGLEIAAEVSTGAYDHQTLPFGGALLVKNGVARIFKDEEIADTTGVTDLVQCCPRLIEKGAAVQGVGGEDRAPRTFLLTDDQGHWAFGVSSGIGLQELADILATPGVITELRTQRALNLDGGPSSGLWCSETNGTEHYQREAWPVRNMLLLLPRKKG